MSMCNTITTRFGEACLAEDLVLTVNIEVYPERVLYLNANINNTGGKDYFVYFCNFPHIISGDQIEILSTTGERVFCDPSWNKICALQFSHYPPVRLPAHSVLETQLPLSSSCAFWKAESGTYNVTVLYRLPLYGDPDLKVKEASGIITATTSFELE